MNRLEDLKTLQDTELKSNFVLGLCSIAACLTIPFWFKAPTQEMKALASAFGFTAGVAGLVSGKQGEKARLKLQDWEDVSEAAFTTNLARDMSPKMFQVAGQGEVDTSEVVVSPFDWNELKDKRDEYPHLLLLGKTGAGKSILAENLCTRLGGKVLAVAPHYKRGDYANASIIIGAGRKVGESMLPYSDEPVKGKSQDTDPELDFDDIVNKRVSASAAQFLNALLREMNRRYQLVDPETGEPDENGIYQSEFENAPVYNIILDETPILAQLPGWRSVFSKLIREARKVGLRLIVLTQGKEVKALGIEGEGSIRESLTFIWLYPFVKDEAERILGSKKSDEHKAYWTQVIKMLSDNKYSCLVEDQFAFSPVTPQYLAMRGELATQAESKRRQVVPEEASKPSEPSQPVGHTFVINNSANASSVSTASSGEEGKAPQLARKAQWKAMKKALEKMPMTQAIEYVFHVKGGRNYAAMKEYVKELEAEFGKLG
jgi:DNA polymerase III delta prime subunit